MKDCEFSHQMIWLPCERSWFEFESGKKVFPSTEKGWTSRTGDLADVPVFVSSPSLVPLVSPHDRDQFEIRVYLDGVVDCKAEHVFYESEGEHVVDPEQCVITTFCVESGVVNFPQEEKGEEGEKGEKEGEKGEKEGEKEGKLSKQQPFLERSEKRA